MKASTWIIWGGVLIGISTVASEDSCANFKESAIAKRLAASLGINAFTFIESEQNVGILKKIRDFAKNGLFSSVADPLELDAIFSNGLRRNRFFEKRTILVTKEKLNFTRALEKLSGLDSATWVVFLESIGQIRHAYIPVNANFFAVHCASNGIVINKAYHVRPGMPLSVESVQNWGEGDDGEGALKVRRNSNVDFKKAKLNLLFLNRLFPQGDEDCNRTLNHVLDKIECFHHEVVKIIAERLNSTVNNIKCPNGQYPYNYPNGSVSDMFLILHRNEADISSGSYMVTRERLRDMDFAWPVFTTRSMMYIKYESATSSWRAYLRPIETRLWSAIVAWIIITGFLFQFFEESQTRHSGLRFSLMVRLMKSVFLSLQVFCNQGVHNVPRRNSSRVVLTLSLFLCLSLYGAYCAFLISALTVTAPIVPFTGLDEFLRDRTFRIMTLKRGFHNYFVKKMLREHGETGTELFEKESRLPVSSSGGISMLCTVEKLTFVEFRENLVQSELPCKIVELPKPMFYESIGLAFPKDSPYDEMVNRHITVLRSTGILHRMRRSLLSYVSLRERETSDEQFINVSLWHVVSIFVVIGVGTVASVVIFFLEIFSHVWYRFWYKRFPKTKKTINSKRK